MDKYVDALVILGVGLSGIAIVSGFLPVPKIADFAIIGLAMTGSLMNTFIKPVVYAEIGYRKKWKARSTTRLKASGSFAGPTFLFLILGGITGFIWVSVIIIAICTNLSAIQRIVYFSRTLS